MTPKQQAIFSLAVTPLMGQICFERFVSGQYGWAVFYLAITLAQAALCFGSLREIYRRRGSIQ